MKIKEITAKSILTKSNLPESDYCINPYVGCLHGCKYCYARFMRRFTGHKENWGQFLDIKINAPQILEKELSRKKKKGGIVLLGSVTDAYQPIEKKYKITRALLELLLQHQYSVSILTKSDLVLRDIDILKGFKKCEVGLTITSMDDKLRKHFEPRSSPVKNRVKALETLHNEGIYTYIFIGPIFPYLINLEAIFKAVHRSVDSYMAESLNARCGNWAEVENVLRKEYPQIPNNYKQIVKDSSIWNKVEEELQSLGKKYSIPMTGFYHH